MVALLVGVKKENEELKTRLLILERRALKYAALASENNELRRLLNSSEVLDDRVIVGEVVAVSPDPFSHEVVINKGSNDGVTTGQAVLDAEGLLGQVIQVRNSQLGIRDRLNHQHPRILLERRFQCCQVMRIHHRMIHTIPTSLRGQ